MKLVQAIIISFQKRICKRLQYRAHSMFQFYLLLNLYIIANVALPMRILMPATLLVMLLAIIQSCKANLRRCWYAAFGFVLSVPTTEHEITSGSELEIRPELAEGLSIPV